MKNIVVHDPSGDNWDGAVILSKDAHPLAERGGCSLPCHVEDFGLAGFAGFAKRSWGSGYPLPQYQPQHFAPIAIYKVRSGPMMVHWAARLVPTAEAKAHVLEGRRVEGNVRIASPPGRGNLHHCTMGEIPGGNLAVDLGGLGMMDDDDGWNVTGSGSFCSGPEGLYGLSLYGFGPGVRAAWLAVSLTP